MWLKLLQKDSNISRMIKPQYINGSWRKPVISGSQKAELKQYFQMCNVPWIYEKPEPEVAEKSIYNRRPKGQRHELNFESRLATIRKNLSMQEERLDKLRQDRYDKMKPYGLDKTIFMILKSMNVDAANAARKGAAQRRAEAAVEKQQAKEMGIETKKRSTSKKSKGQSRGGLINKKLRASLELSGASFQDMEEGKGYSTTAARDLQAKSKEKQPQKQRA